MADEVGMEAKAQAAIERRARQEEQRQEPRVITEWKIWQGSDDGFFKKVRRLWRDMARGVAEAEKESPAAANKTGNATASMKLEAVPTPKKNPPRQQLPSFVSAVSENVIWRQMRGGTALLIIAALMYEFLPDVPDAFLTVMVSLSLLLLLDAVLVAWRQRSGTYGLNEIEATEIAHFIIEKTKEGKGPGGFNGIFKDEKERKQAVTEDGTLAGAAAAR